MSSSTATTITVVSSRVKSAPSNTAPMSTAKAGPPVTATRRSSRRPSRRRRAAPRPVRAQLLGGQVGGQRHGTQRGGAFLGHLRTGRRTLRLPALLAAGRLDPAAVPPPAAARRPPARVPSPRRPGQVGLLERGAVRPGEDGDRGRPRRTAATPGRPRRGPTRRPPAARRRCPNGLGLAPDPEEDDRRRERQARHDPLRPSSGQGPQRRADRPVWWGACEDGEAATGVSFQQRIVRRWKR